MYSVTFTHPKYGEQQTDRNTLKDIMDWLSYMVYMHEISNIKLFHGVIGENEIFDFKIPKWR